MKVGDLVYDAEIGQNGVIVCGQWHDPNRLRARGFCWDFRVRYESGEAAGVMRPQLQVVLDNDEYPEHTQSLREIEDEEQLLQLGKERS